MHVCVMLHNFFFTLSLVNRNTKPQDILREGKNSSGIHCDGKNKIIVKTNDDFAVS